MNQEKTTLDAHDKAMQRVEPKAWQDDEEREIDLVELGLVLLENIRYIVLSALIGALLCNAYTGKKLTPKITVYDTEGRRVSSKYYSVKLSGRFTAGNHKVIITAKAPYTGRITTAFKIYKASNPFKISVGKKSFNRNMKVAQSTRIKVSGVKEQAKYIIKSNKSGVTIAHNRIIIKKGWYGTATITVKTAATKNYKSTTKTIMIKVKK